MNLSKFALFTMTGMILVLLFSSRPIFAMCSVCGHPYEPPYHYSGCRYSHLYRPPPPPENKTRPYPQRDKSEKDIRESIDKYDKRLEQILREASKKAGQDKADYLYEQEQSEQKQKQRLYNAREAEKSVHIFNEKGIEAYNMKDWGGATRFFQMSLSFAPDNFEVLHNLKKAQSKINKDAITYLSSINTAWGIVSISPSLLILHPDPYVRIEAQKQLAQSTLEEIANAATVFILEERLNPNVIKPFPWETDAEKKAKIDEAKRHAKEIKALRLKAHQEARETVQKYAPKINDNNKVVKIETKPAMKQLLEISINGFQ